MTGRSDLADLHGFGDLYPDAAVLGARAKANSHVVITKPKASWPFMAIGGRDAPVREPRVKDRSAAWLRNAMIGLAVLAIAAATVSYAAQFVMVDAARKITFISALEAGIPDVGALIFASLGIALALQGRRAIRARVLNLGAVAASVFMNYAAAGRGWRDLAIWVMPPVAYALASDTAIGVVRAWAIARQKQLNETLADDEATPLAIFGRVVLYGLRLVLATGETARGLRQALLNATPLPGTDAAQAVGPPERDRTPEGDKPKAARRSGEGKQAALIRLAAERHDLDVIDPASVSRIATALASQADLHPATARRVLAAHVRALQNGGQP